MNEKASVSKEVNAKNLKILESLLKLPENRECADCRSRAPRWASVNLGIFICMQCSGIHRSLGVHISKVRSTTLDTWLPEQVTFMRAMGNEKSNSYWEAELPPNYGRTSIEQFIRAKYEEKRWASKNMPNPIYAACEKRSDVPRKARKYSLEEDRMNEHISQEPSVPRHRVAGSLDMNNMMNNLVISPPPKVPENNASTNKGDASTDLFSLLYAPEAKHDRVVVPPSRWETFEWVSVLIGIIPGGLDKISQILSTRLGYFSRVIFLGTDRRKLRRGLNVLLVYNTVRSVSLVADVIENLLE